jgi:hypothetical protein
MSYDFYLSRQTPEENDQNIIEQSLQESMEINPGLPIPENEQRKKDLAKSLLAYNPALQIFEFDYKAIARSLEIAEDEARTRYRHIEINDPDQTKGIQIILYDDTASVTIPYWHMNEDAVSAFNEIFGYLRILQNEAKYLIYDPQIERVINLSKDLSEVLKCYDSVMQRIENSQM